MTKAEALRVLARASAEIRALPDGSEIAAALVCVPVYEASGDGGKPPHVGHLEGEEGVGMKLLWDFVDKLRITTGAGGATC